MSTKPPSVKPLLSSDLPPVPKQKRKRKRQSKTYEQLLAAAVKVFSKKGYHNTSIEELMDSIGIAKSVLYYYFKSKEELFATIIEMGVSSFIAMLKEAIREESDIRGRLEAAARTYVYFYEHNVDFFRVLVDEVRIPRQNFATKYPDFYQAYRDVLADIISEGVRSGIIRPLDPQVAAQALVGMLDIFLVQHSSDDVREKMNIGKIFPEVFGIYWNGIRS